MVELCAASKLPSFRQDPAAWAGALKISRDSINLYLSSDVIDLHIDSFIWTRIFGYQLQLRHTRGLLAARYCRQVDIPRIRDAQITGATWVITTNPWRSAKGRAKAFARNREKLTAILASAHNDVCIVRTLTEYAAARTANRHAAFVGIQGGNALEDPASWELLNDQTVLRVTLVHLTNSALGCTSSPLNWGRDRGLSKLGREFIEYLNYQKVLVDLAHASEQTFWDAVTLHDRSLPFIVSHTGMSSVYNHWRNLTDNQLRAVADTGGVVGVFFHGPYLGGGPFGGRVREVAKHIVHAVRKIGAEHVALGSDWDGMIATPLDMPTCLELPILVQALQNEKLTDDQIQLVLGGSFLRLLRIIRT